MQTEEELLWSQAGPTYLGGSLHQFFLKDQSFESSAADPCLLFRLRGKERTYLAIWVDDAIIASSQQSAIDALLTTMDEKFENKGSHSHPFCWH